MKQKYNLPLIACALLIFSGCSTLDNRQSMVKETLETRIKQESQGAITLLSFQKTDGQERVESGVKSYLMNFSAVIQYQKECYKNGGFTGWRYADFTVSFRQPEGWNSYWESTGYHYRPGTKVALTGQAYLEKSDNGWRIGEFNITNATPTK